MRDGARRWSGSSWRRETPGGTSTRSRGSTRSARWGRPRARIWERGWPSCGFQLGASSPQAALEDAMEGIRRALEIKLAALSQSMIARLIRDHDKENRLEGFLKITQAAQTDALVRVLDEKLARYLAQVLDERD